MLVEKKDSYFDSILMNSGFYLFVLYIELEIEYFVFTIKWNGRIKKVQYRKVLHKVTRLIVMMFTAVHIN